MNSPLGKINFREMHPKPKSVGHILFPLISVILYFGGLGLALPIVKIYLVSFGASSENRKPFFYLSSGHQTTTRWHSKHMHIWTVVVWLFGHCLVVVWSLHGCCSAFVRPLFGCCLVVVWSLFGRCLAVDSYMGHITFNYGCGFLPFVSEIV